MSSEFDWYRLSLLDLQKPDLQKFQAIIRNANISKGLDRVPTSYRKNLLTIFQTLSTKMKYQTKSMQNVNQSLAFKKNAIAIRLEQMQSGLEESKLQLVRVKSVVSQKKKMVKKLVQKIETLKKNKTQQTYFCPFCSRNDFGSREIFTFHMYSEHQTYKAEQENNMKFSMPNNSLSMSAHNELKDFIMTLKDKEMQMMKMILSQKKELETQELQRLYEREMNLMTIKNSSQPQYLSQNKYSMSQNAKNYSEYGEDVNLGAENGQEIHGESQFLFYQKSDKYKQAAQKEEYSLRRALQSRKKELNSHPYYDIFKNMEENKSLNVDAQHLEEENSNIKYFVPESHQDHQEQFYAQNQNYKILSKFNLKSNPDLNEGPKPPVQPLKMTSTNLKFQEFNPSITDRLKEEEKKNAHTNSIYSGFGKNPNNKPASSQHEYVFNSGPLVDDHGGYSDYEDYFGEDIQANQKAYVSHSFIKKPQQNQSINFSMSKEIHNTITVNKNPKSEESLIEDEEIKLNPGSYSFVSRSSYSKNHISQLLSPNKDQPNISHLQDSKNVKDKYNKYHSIHEKSSEIVDLSDSFSRRDFELSKDQSSINLSDLKLSKLQKKRLNQKERAKLNPQNNPQTYGVTQQQKNSQIEGSFAKKPLEFVLVSEQKHFNISRSIQNEQKINLLSEFQKKIDIPKPLMPQSYSFQKRQTYELNQFYRQPPHPPMAINRNQSSEPSNRSSKLDQFMRNEFTRNENKSPNVQENNQERALSPHDFFAKQLKKNSSYGTFNQFQSNNQQSYVSESSSSQVPKVDLSQYERPSSKSKRGSFENIQQHQSSQNSSQKSSGRNKKRLQRHEELQGEGRNGLLDEFLKNEFQGERIGASMEKRDSQKMNNKSPYIHSQYNSKKDQENSYKISQSYEESSALDQFIK